MRSRSMEFYRFVSAVLILCYHCNFFLFNNTEYFATSYLLVELFFILAGFLMYRSIRRRGPVTDCVGSALWYMKGRLRQLYPHHLFSWLLIAFIAVFVTREMGLGELLQKGWPELLLVNIFGFVRAGSVNIVCWYLSGLLFASTIVYYLLVKNERLFICLLAPLLIVLLYGCLYDGKGSLAATILFTRYARFYGFFRSLADICVGCLAWRLYEHWQDKSLHGEAAWATLYEAAVFIAIGVSTVKYPGLYDFYYVPLFFGFVISVFRGRSLFSRLFDTRLSEALGTLSYAFYLNNLAVILPYRHFFPEESSIGRMCLICGGACLVLSVVSTWLVDKIARRLIPRPAPHNF